MRQKLTRGAAEGTAASTRRESAEQPLRSASATLLRLQRSAGNGAVAGLVRRGAPTVQRQPPGGPVPAITPATTAGSTPGAPGAAFTVVSAPPANGALVRHTGTGVTFSADPAYTRYQLEEYADKHGLDSVSAFESKDELFINAPDPLNPVQQGHSDADPEYLRRVVSVVHSEIVTLRAHLSTFRDDFQGRANDTLQSVLTDSENRLKVEMDKYGVKAENHSFLGIVSWRSFSGADNDASAALAADALSLKNKLPEVRDAREAYDAVMMTSGNWVYNPGVLDAARAKYVPVQHEYDNLRNQVESKHPMLMAYNLDAHAPETEHNLEKVASKDASARAEAIGKELTTRQDNIAKVRKAAEDKKYVWKLDKIVGVTRELPDIKKHALLTNPHLQASVAIEQAATVQAVEEMVTLGGGLVLLALAAISAVPTGGLSVAGAATVATGTAETMLQVAMAYRAYDKYRLDAALAGTDYDNAKALSQEQPDLFWLALDLIGAAASLGGGAAKVSALFKELSALREEALIAKAVKMANATKDLEGSAAASEQAAAKLEARGEQAVLGTGKKLRAEVDKADPSRVRSSSSVDDEPPTHRNPNVGHDPDAEPPTVPNPDVAAAKLGNGLSRSEAVGQYFTAINANPDREYGLIQHEVTKQFRVVTGQMDEVTIPGTYGEGWHFVRHYHPNLATNPEIDFFGPIAQDSKQGVFGARIPSIGGLEERGDLLGAMNASNMRRGKFVSETIDWWDPLGNRMRSTKFGYTPGAQRPFWIEMPLGPSDVAKRQTFETLALAKAWVSIQQLPN
jgi:hypothetical protein